MTTATAGIEVMDVAKVSFSQAKSLTVKTVQARQIAADLWDAIRAFRKQAEGQKEEVIRPLKTAWDDAKVPFDSFIKECMVYESHLKVKMSEWDMEQDRLARAEQARIQAEIDKKNIKIVEKAEAKGVEPVLKVAPVVAAPAKSIQTQAGTTQTRTVKKVYTPSDLASLMKDFPQLFDINMAKFNALAKTGILDGRKDVKVDETFVYSQR